jgi:hypothetical protein
MLCRVLERRRRCQDSVPGFSRAQSFTAADYRKILSKHNEEENLD